MTPPPANPALLAAALAFQVVSLAVVVWWHLRRSLPPSTRHLGRESILITVVVLLGFIGGVIAAMEATQGRVAGRYVWVAALVSGSALGYAVLMLMMKRIFHLAPGRALGLAARIGLMTLFVWVVASFAAQSVLRALAGR